MDVSEGSIVDVDLTGLGLVQARVVRQRKRVKGFGAEFIELDGTIRNTIRAWDSGSLAA